jgi:hypothetical protein
MPEGTLGHSCPSEFGVSLFRAEAYNALNTPQFSATTEVRGATPITQAGTLNFGKIAAASVAPRLFQLGRKYIY